MLGSVKMASPMMHRMYATAFIASLSVALTLAPSESFGRSEAALRVKSPSTNSAFRPSAMRSRVHANFSSRRDHGQRNAGWALWATAGGFYGPSNVEPNVNVTPSISGDVHYTYTYDVPWDAVHRYPRVYEYPAGCRSQTETVPRGDGKKQSVNIVRCY